MGGEVGVELVVGGKRERRRWVWRILENFQAGRLVW